jgi:hypothetical protein
MISDRHHGLLNGAKDPIEEYPPLIHMWYSRYFAANIWKKQWSKEVIARLNALCKVKEEKKFKARLKKLEKILNDDAKAWLLEKLLEKSKWPLAFDDGDAKAWLLAAPNLRDPHVPPSVWGDHGDAAGRRHDPWSSHQRCTGFWDGVSSWVEGLCRGCYRLATPPPPCSCKPEG